MRLINAIVTSFGPTRNGARPIGSEPTVVLVHGEWADGSSWSDVISRLQERGVPVISVQIPLSSLADDVSSVERAMTWLTGPIILVGHSWGGTVITQAGADSRVKALVYVCAFAPDIGESTNDLQEDYPPPAYLPHLKQDSAGFLWFPQETMPTYFAQDLPRINARVLAATQTAMRASAFDEQATIAAWRGKASWYLETTQDRMIPHQLQRTMAGRIQSTVRSVRSSHVPFMSRAKETTAIVMEAVKSVRDSVVG